MQEWTRQIQFTEDGGEFNQIGRNLAMICATIASIRVPIGSIPGRNRNSGPDGA
jgi:hypothetical protein